MIVSTIRQLLESEPGPVEAVAGTVSAVYDRIVGGEGKKAWSIQNLMLAGEDGSKIKVKLWRRPEFDKQKCVGHKLYIVASSGKRASGPVGLKTELDTYKGETKLILTVQETCEVTFQAPAGFPAQSSAPRQTVTPPAVPPRPAPAPEPMTSDEPPFDSGYLPSPEEMGPAPTEHQYVPPPQHPATPSAPVQPAIPGSTKDAWSKADHTLNKYRRAYLRCISVASKVQEDGKLMGVEIPATGIQELATTFFIQMTRDGTMLSVPNIDPPNLPQF